MKHSLILLIVLFGLGQQLYGQAAKSPFSSLGYGDYYGESLINNQGMAGTGVSNPQVWYLNNQNPALLPYNRITVFQAGLVTEDKRIASETDKGRSRNGNLNYLALGMPLKRNSDGVVQWATAIGLMPYSTVNYNYSYIGQTNGINVIYDDKAVGGFNQFYWSNGFRLMKGLNVGVKTSFMFSSISGEYTNKLYDTTQLVKYLITTYELQAVRGVKFTPGFSYRIDSIKRKYNFNVGATFEIGRSISSKKEDVMLRKNIAGSIMQTDTLASSNSKVVFPNRITAGVSFGKFDKWMVASDFTLTDYGKSSITVGSDITPVQKGYRWSLGAELTPDVRSLSSYLKRVTYRAGLSTERGSYIVNGNAVKDFGINFGFSFPVNRISSIDVAFRSGKRGDKKLNGIEENYFKIYFGITFNDQWFIKRKFD